jgi:hypothetical protein
MLETAMQLSHELDNRAVEVSTTLNGEESTVRAAGNVT